MSRSCYQNTAINNQAKNKFSKDNKKAEEEQRCKYSDGNSLQMAGQLNQIKFHVDF